jgi:starvation-inducible DNA-binding protein
VTGPLFKPLHEHLDELVDSWRELSDVVAERAVAVGYFPDGQSATVAAGSNLHRVERGALDDHVVVRELTGRLADVAERARERMDRLGEIDAASQDVVIEVLRELEKQLWMIRAQFAHQVEVRFALTRAWPEDYAGHTGRIDPRLLSQIAGPPADRPLIYVCGPNGFVEAAANWLVELGHAPERIRTERFGPSGT